jgi:hypothetical protein
MTSLFYHTHAYVGVEIHYILLPPFVLPMPVGGMTLPACGLYLEDVAYKEHEHSLSLMPSLDISFQQLLSLTFSIHGHQIEASGVDLEGAFSMTATLSPPPLS